MLMFGQHIYTIIFPVWCLFDCLFSASDIKPYHFLCVVYISDGITV